MSVSVDYSVTEESFDALTAYQHAVKWDLFFVLPAWLRAWWQTFGAGAELYITTVRQRNQVVGIAPLLIRDNTASFIGSVDVCDYLDFVVVAGRERDFFAVLLDTLRAKGVHVLDLSSLRPESTVLTHLVAVARERGYEASTQQEDVSLELDLPATWEGYLDTLTTKQRHEVRRKLRVLAEEGRVNYQAVADNTAIRNLMDTFLHLFAASREDKAKFMTPAMESFFRSVVGTMVGMELLRFGILELDRQPVAIVMYFDYHNSIYLYNSGYDPRYRSLSVGLLSKVLCIRDNISRRKQKFDFLKGGEAYKYHLGGKEIPLYRCQITIK